MFKVKAIVYTSRCLDYANDVRWSFSLFQGYSIGPSFSLLLKELCDRDSVYHSFSSDIADMLWPPPTWFWPDAFSSRRDEEQQPDFCNQTVQLALMSFPMFLSIR